MRGILPPCFLHSIMTWGLDIVVPLDVSSLNELMEYLNRWEYLYSVFFHSTLSRDKTNMLQFKKRSPGKNMLTIYKMRHFIC